MWGTFFTSTDSTFASLCSQEVFLRRSEKFSTIAQGFVGKLTPLQTIWVQITSVFPKRQMRKQLHTLVCIRRYKGGVKEELAKLEYELIGQQLF